MSNAAILRHLRSLSIAERTDRELLRAFAVERDENAFAALVRRHGPLVLGVCRRLLGHEQDAEDAFQATFLVLARRAASLPGETIGGWLHGVAWNMAQRVRRATARQHARETQAKVRETQGPVAEASLRELQALLDAEVARLPEKLRSPFVLCCLEGRSKAEAARELGWKEGTVSSRLAQARERLRARLVRRGVTLTAALTAVAVTQDASASLPPVLLRATCAAAQAFPGNTITTPAGILAQEALRSGMPKVQFFALALLAGVVTAGVLSYRYSAGNGPPSQSQEPKSASLEPAPKVDRFGDPLPDGAIARLGTVRFRHMYTVSSLAYSPDGKMIASGADAVRIWDAATGRELRRLAQESVDYTVAFSADGKRLAAVDQQQFCILWDVATGEEIRRFDCLKSGSGATFLAADKMLVTGGKDETVRLWDVEAGKEIQRFPGKKNGVYALAVSPDGKTVASALHGGEVRMFEVATGKELRRLPSLAVRAFAFAPDGKALAGVCWPGDIVVWNASTGKELQHWKKDTTTPSCLAFSPDGKRLAIGGLGIVVVLDTATGNELTRCHGARMALNTVSFAPDGKTLAAAGEDHVLRQWDVATGKEVRPLGGPEGQVEYLAFASDGKMLASAGRDQAVRLWNVGTGEQLRIMRGDNLRERISAACSPDGKLVAMGAKGRGIYVYEASSGKEVLHLDIGDNWISGLAFAPDGKLLASSGGRLEIWDMTTGKLRTSLKTPPGSYSVAFSPDGKHIASGHGSKIRLWDVTTAKEMWSFDAPKYFRPDKLAFSPDGRILASCAKDNFALILDTATGKETARLEGPAVTLALAFSPDGRTLACLGMLDSIWLWEMATLKERCRMVGHKCDYDGTLAFSPDGRVLASGGDDTTILLWDVTGRALRGPLTLSPSELEARWKALAGEDAMAAHRAIWELVAAAKDTLPFLAKHLRPSASLTPDQEKRIGILIQDLNSDRLPVRKKAVHELEQLGEAVLPALQSALENAVPPKARRHLEQLIEKVQDSGNLQQMRAIEVLEHIATPEARQILQKLADGARKRS